MQKHQLKSVNDAFEYSKDKLNMPVSFDAEVGIDKIEEKAYVIINLNLGDLEDIEKTKVPFTCNVSIRGIFSYEAKDFNTNNDLIKRHYLTAVPFCFTKSCRQESKILQLWDELFIVR